MGEALRFWETVTLLALTACGGRAIETYGAAGQASQAGTSSGGARPNAGGAGGSGAASAGTGGTGGALGGTTGACGRRDGALFTFDSDSEGFAYEIYLADDLTRTNIGETSTLDWDEGTGPDCVAGRLRLDIAFNAPSQFVDIQVSQPMQDFSGRTLRALVGVGSGYWSGDVSPGGAYLFVKTGPEYVWGRGETVNLPPAFVRGNWTELVFSLDAPDAANSGFDPTAVGAIGIQFYDNTAEEFGFPSPAVVYVDNLTLR